MKEYIEERVLETSNYIVENNSTVRQCARQFGISKSTVHKDVSERLPQINQRLAIKVREVLDKNKKNVTYVAVLQQRLNMKKIKALTDKSVRLLFTGDLVGVSPTRLSMKNLKYAIIGYDVYKLYAQALSTRKKYLITRTVFIIKGTYEQNMNRM